MRNVKFVNKELLFTNLLSAWFLFYQGRVEQKWLFFFLLALSHLCLSINFKEVVKMRTGVGKMIYILCREKNVQHCFITCLKLRSIICTICSSFTRSRYLHMRCVCWSGYKLQWTYILLVSLVKADYFCLL